jgi:hypothetical protein
MSSLVLNFLDNEIHFRIFPHGVGEAGVDDAVAEEGGFGEGHRSFFTFKIREICDGSWP